MTYKISVVHSKTVMNDVVGSNCLSRIWYYSVLPADYGKGNRLMRLEEDMKLEQTANTQRERL